MTLVSDILDVFNIERISDRWFDISSNLNNNCSKSMIDYMNGLKTGKLWALKIDDASGHYTSGFFYGNNYWMGSLSLCQSIYKKQNEINNHKENSKSKKNDISYGKGHYHMKHIKHENPPFMPGFYVLKIRVNETMMAHLIRTIHIGICLPSSCGINDVKYLTEASQFDLQNRELTIMDIRSPTLNPYNMWSDKTFLILFFVTVIVFVLMIFGTIYDIYLIRRYKSKIIVDDDKETTHSETSSGIGCSGSSEYSDTVTQELKKDLKELNLVLSLPQNDENNHHPLDLHHHHHHHHHHLHHINHHDAQTDSHTDVQLQLHEPKKLSVYSELLLSFSIITNFNAICDRNVGSDTIPSIHGLRAISMAWVILGHTCIVVFKYSDNMELRKEVEKNFLFQAVTNGPFSVDTFFFISGFLVSFIYFRTNAKGKLKKLSKGVNEVTAGTFHFLGLVGYRFVRLTAPYMFVLGIVEVSMKYLASNSVFEPPTLDHVNCPKYWWRNVLYINTLFPVDDMCMLWSWYLANDTQFYIIGAIILIVAVRHLKIATITLALFLISSWITTAIIAFTHNHMPNTDDPLALFDKIYDKPWTRLGPYLIGMSVGWILFKSNCKIRMNKMTVFLGWTTSITVLLLLIFGLYNTRLSQVTAAAYSSLSHSAWALSLAWITIACSTGYGGFINSLLSASCIYPFSRVTYCAYLVHPIVIRALALNSDAPLHLGSDSMVITFFGLVVCSYLLSFIVSLSFEAPVVTMLKILSPNRKKRIS
ncbi:nose resistant to fluoxetine protein 6-like [Condylostylus longicornis]|uniref:nose resistant to fluoxetine protein 6-like n=1 Tax=Condylostylus longicornis TaxID=2530218 RepID=UPI00244E3A29|nr:nose resistant to fluoxetine protein 6-like [Condylostylus longicornis]